MTDPTPMTTPALQAKVRIRQAWFEAHPGQPLPEGRAQVDRLIEEIEAGAVMETMAPRPAGRLSAILAGVAAELGRAIRKHPPLHSPHEGYAVILEEVEELLEVGSRDVVTERIRPPLDRLWTLVKADRGRSGEARAEAIQIAAMALRYVLDLDLAATAAEAPHG